MPDGPLSDSQSNSTSPVRVTPQEYLAFRKGAANSEESERIRQALLDPQSELCQWLRGVEDWAGRVLNPDAVEPIGRMDRIERKAIVEFVRARQAVGAINDEQASRIFAEGMREPEPKQSGDDIGAANERMKETIAELAPALADELRQLLIIKLDRSI